MGRGENGLNKGRVRKTLRGRRRKREGERKVGREKKYPLIREKVTCTTCE